tara:strand:- start:706 stop:1080 length:375 start_codon:yes stop_codon:yes gene_type:complete
MDIYKDIIERFYNIKLDKKSKKRKYVYARAIYYYICKKYDNYSATIIAKSVNKHHSTVLYSLKELPHMLKYDKKLHQDFFFIRELCNFKNKPVMDLEELLHKYNTLVIKYDILKEKSKKRQFKF